MDKTFDEDIALIRKAERGVEVREAIAQGMEHVEKISETCEKQSALATTKAAEAASSASTAQTAARTATAKAAEATRQAEAASGYASTAASDVTALLKSYTDSALESKKAAAASQTAAKTSETESAKNLQGTREYYEQVRTITIGAQGWYATPEALKAAVPVGENGWWAVVGTTDTIWTWDSDTGEWKDSIQKADLSDYYTRTQTDQKFTALKAELYPVGSIYQSTDPTSPAALFGGIWEEIAQERTLMGASSTHAAGTIAEAGLPNIEGRTTTVPMIANVAQARPWFTGAFSRFDPNSTPSNPKPSNPISGYGTPYIGLRYSYFDASLSNAIYGASDTVQPAAYYVYIWHRVA